MKTNKARIQHDLEVLATYTSTPGHGVTRSSYSKEDVQYTIEKLYEARYIRIVDVSTDSQRYMINGYIDDITWEGYNFLNNIREKSIWEATKEGAKKVGAMSISAISMISFEIVKAVVTNQEVINKIVAHIPWVK